MADGKSPATTAGPTPASADSAAAHRPLIREVLLVGGRNAGPFAAHHEPADRCPLTVGVASP
jgi:hypothetical protein